jgi:hypothetical protein
MSHYLTHLESHVTLDWGAWQDSDARHDNGGWDFLGHEGCQSVLLYFVERRQSLSKLLLISTESFLLESPVLEPSYHNIVMVLIDIE